MKIRFIGDVHGKFEQLRKILAPDMLNVQVGDFGFGFRIIPDFHQYNLKLIRGNHDMPAVARESPLYLGEYGNFAGFFFVSGAHSPDWRLRTIGVDFWGDEELSFREMSNAISAWETSSSTVIVSHDAPSSITEQLLGYAPSMTTQGLQAIFEKKPGLPKLWIFGHHHREIDITVRGTRFIGLEELDYIDIETDNL